MNGRARSTQRRGGEPRGQHLIRSDGLAAELVHAADIRPTEHVLEIGAGAGRLTEPLSLRARLVTAVELDRRFAATLDRRFANDPAVRIVRGDILSAPFPGGRWRAFGNVPFGLTTPILRRLLDEPEAGPDRCDLVVQFEAARKRASVERATLLSLGWGPWWALSLTRRIGRLAFEPPPSVDAGVLTAVRRSASLLDPRDRAPYIAMLGQAFEHGSWPVRRSLVHHVPGTVWKRLARDRGLMVDAPPAALDVWDWVAVFGAGEGSRAGG